MIAPVPPVTVHVAFASLIASLTFTVTGAEFGLLTAIEPLTAQALSVPASRVTLTVYVKVAPSAVSISVLSTSFLIVHLKVRVNAGVASFVAVNALASGMLPKLRPEAEPGPVFGSVSV